MAPRASIVVVTHGHREITERCLRSLQACLGDGLGREWELVLVDNASPDDTPELLRGWSSRASVMLLAENRNFAGGCNVGAVEASGEVLVFLNNDTEVTPGALQTVVEQALEPGVAAAGCRLLFPDGTVQHAGVAFIYGTAYGGAAMPQHILHGQDGELPAASAAYELDCVTAACLAIRAATFHEVGGFDEGYVNGLEDVDLCLRVRATGARIVYRGDATVVHHEGCTRGRGQQLSSTAEQLAVSLANDLRLLDTWGSLLGDDSELAETTWGARLRSAPPQRHELTGDILVVGQPSGIGPAADEARGFIVALEAIGRLPVSIDVPNPLLVSGVSGPAAAVLERAATRSSAVVGSPWLVIPSGQCGQPHAETPTILRLARARTAVRWHGGEEIWAVSAAVADDIVEAGFPASQITVVAPPVAPARTGPGGAGVLAVVPVHDRRRCEDVLDALARLPRTTAIRLLPTVMNRGTAAEIAQRLPHAQLGGPCQDEDAFAALAGVADVVLAADRDDPFERRALVAASVGAAAITLKADGPAAALLGDGVVADPDDLAGALSARLAEPGDRAARARLVAEACGPDVLAEHLRRSAQWRLAAT